jgi:hypothetical protein
LSKVGRYVAVGINTDTHSAGIRIKSDYFNSFKILQFDVQKAAKLFKLLQDDLFLGPL